LREKSGSHISSESFAWRSRPTFSSVEARRSTEKRHCCSFFFLCRADSPQERSSAYVDANETQEQSDARYQGCIREARILYQAGREEAARRELERQYPKRAAPWGARFRPNIPAQYCILLGKVYEKLKLYAKAKKEYKKVAHTHAHVHPSEAEKRDAKDRLKRVEEKLEEGKTEMKRATEEKKYRTECLR
jgi:hypothetical protein